MAPRGVRSLLNRQRPVAVNFAPASVSPAQAPRPSRWVLSGSDPPQCEMGAEGAAPHGKADLQAPAPALLEASQALHLAVHPQPDDPWQFAYRGENPPVPPIASSNGPTSVAAFPRPPKNSLDNLRSDVAEEFQRPGESTPAGPSGYPLGPFFTGSEPARFPGGLPRADRAPERSGWTYQPSSRNSPVRYRQSVNKAACDAIILFRRRSQRKA